MSPRSSYSFSYIQIRSVELAYSLVEPSPSVGPNMPLFRSSPKSPQELVKALRDQLSILESTEGGSKKSDKVSVRVCNKSLI